MRFDHDPGQRQQRFSRIAAPQLTFEQGQSSDPRLSEIGWYVQAVDQDTRSEARLAKPRKITPDGALLIAQAFDQALSAALGQSVDYFEVGVRQQNEFARSTILAAAEAAELRAEVLTIQLVEEARRRAATLADWDQVAPVGPALDEESENGLKHAFAGS